MKTWLKTFSLVVALAAILVGPAQADTLDAVQDERGNYVIDRYGKCVRTKWQEPYDECAKPAPKPAPVVEKEPVKPAPVRRLTRQDLTIYFDFNESVIEPKEATKLDRVARVLRNSEEVKEVDIVGYADKIGSDAYNNKLSAKRAASVAAYLASKGYQNTNVTEIRALGEASSKEHCKDKTKRENLIACLWKDRKVELEVQYYTED